MGMPLSHSLTRALQSHTLGIAESVRNCFKTSAPSVHMVVMYYIWYWLDLIELDWFKIIQFCSNRPVQSWLFLYLFGMLLHVPIWYKLHINQYQQRKSWLFKVCLLPKLFLMTVQPWQKWSFSLNFAFICSCLLLHTLKFLLVSAYILLQKVVSDAGKYFKLPSLPIIIKTFHLWSVELLQLREVNNFCQTPG